MNVFRAFRRTAPATRVDLVVENRLRARASFAAGDAARDDGDWQAAAGHYAAAAALDPGNLPLLIQYGHALKETGRLMESEVAYRTAALAAPEDADPLLHLGYALKMQGRRNDAIDAFAEALGRKPDSRDARNELIAMGARNRLPQTVYGRSAATDSLTRISQSMADGLAEMRELVTISTFPVEAYDAFRRTYPIQSPPPPRAPTAHIVVWIDARTAAPADLRSTLISLIDQRATAWTAIVSGSAALADHPVASLALQDDRIRFAGPITEAESLLAAHPKAPVLLVSGGARLDREALGWFGFAASRTGADVVYADHDHHVDHWRLGPVHQDPILLAVADIDDATTTADPPAAVLAGPALRAALNEVLSSDGSGNDQRRAVLLAGLQAGRVAHVPRVLTSLRASDAPADPGADPVAPLETRPEPVRTLVVIPTRDEPDLLKTCIETLRGLAARPEALDILVLDNRSELKDTRALLAEMTASGLVEVTTADEPFNWARLNTVAVGGRTHDIVVFANNDMEMLTQDWDDVLAHALARPEVGVVGARLLYPDRTVQHAGVLLGCGEGRPLHEGIGAPARALGPLGRWRRTRAAAAVTGAFMAVRRETFEALGGFDPRFAIGYNDIDFCLSARAAGLTVLYVAGLELIHHESKTRGLNNSPEKIAWDDAELLDMHRRWGAALFRDPSVNPQWASTPLRPFDGFCDLAQSRVLDWIDASARPRPWSITPLDAAEVPSAPRLAVDPS